MIERLRAYFAAACVVGASIICVDLIIRHIPGKRNFRVQDSNPFLSSSLSLSFGVMVCSFVPYRGNGAHVEISSSPRSMAYYLRPRVT